MTKRNMIYSGVALGLIGGATAYMMMNKKTSKKIKKMSKDMVNDATSYISHKVN